MVVTQKVTKVASLGIEPGTLTSVVSSVATGTSRRRAVQYSTLAPSALGTHVRALV